MVGGQLGASGPQTVMLEPGQDASATVEGSDNPVGEPPHPSCLSYPALLVTPPDTTRSVVLSGVGRQGPAFRTEGFPGCSPIVITPVVPGSSGTSSAGPAAP